MFSKHCRSTNVFDLILYELSKKRIFKFPSDEHSREVLAHIIQKYLETRMRQYTKHNMAEEKNDNRSNKKVANLTKN